VGGDCVELAKLAASSFSHLHRGSLAVQPTEETRAGFLLTA